MRLLQQNVALFHFVNIILQTHHIYEAFLKLNLKNDSFPVINLSTRNLTFKHNLAFPFRFVQHKRRYFTANGKCNAMYCFSVSPVSRVRVK